MTDARFSGGNMPGSDDGFGYFPASSSTSTSTPFGGNPGGFGQPAGPATGFGGGMGSAPSRARPSKVVTNLGGFIVVAIIIAIVGGAGWWWMHRGAGLALPDTVVGMPVAKDPGMVAALDQYDAAVQTRRSANLEIKTGAYGSFIPGPGAIVMLVRSKVALSAPPDPAGSKRIGPVLCEVAGGSMACARSEGMRSVAVLGISGPGNPTLQADTVAEWVQEIWNTQGQ